MSAIPFLTPISFGSHLSSFSQEKILEVVDSYFYLKGRVAVVIPCMVGKAFLVDAHLNWPGIFFRVASYSAFALNRIAVAYVPALKHYPSIEALQTVLDWFPIAMLVMKVILRFGFLYEESEEVRAFLDPAPHAPEVTQFILNRFDLTTFIEISEQFDLFKKDTTGAILWGKPFLERLKKKAHAYFDPPGWEDKLRQESVRSLIGKAIETVKKLPREEKINFLQSLIEIKELSTDKIFWTTIVQDAEKKLFLPDVPLSVEQLVQDWEKCKNMAVLKHFSKDKPLLLTQFLGYFLSQGRSKNEVFDLFLETLRCLSKEHVQYFLEKHPTLTKELTLEERFKCWTSCENPSFFPLLIQGKFNPNIRNSEGDTPLMVQLKEPSSKSPTIVEGLLKAGANPWLLNKKGFSSFFLPTGQNQYLYAMLKLIITRHMALEVFKKFSFKNETTLLKSNDKLKLEGINALPLDILSYTLSWISPDQRQPTVGVCKHWLKGSIKLACQEFGTSDRDSTSLLEVKSNILPSIFEDNKQKVQEKYEAFEKEHDEVIQLNRIENRIELQEKIEELRERQDDIKARISNKFGNLVVNSMILVFYLKEIIDLTKFSLLTAEIELAKELDQMGKEFAKEATPLIAKLNIFYKMS